MGLLANVRQLSQRWLTQPRTLFDVAEGETFGCILHHSACTDTASDHLDVTAEYLYYNGCAALHLAVIQQTTEETKRNFN
jgi:hypothetical protein